MLFEIQKIFDNYDSWNMYGSLVSVAMLTVFSALFSAVLMIHFIKCHSNNIKYESIMCNFLGEV